MVAMVPVPTEVMDTEKEPERGAKKEPGPTPVAIPKDVAIGLVVELSASVLVASSVDQEKKPSVPVFGGQNYQRD